MKLIIQIPAYNEEQTLAIALNDLPKKIHGISKIEVLVVDDGSTDRTSEIAKENGVHHIVKLEKNLGLAKAFMAGLTECINQGADIIVNTDADNQYCGEDIEKLVRPILEKQADIVIGARPISRIGHFSPLKKMLQKLGSAVMRLLSFTNIEDAPSGFRAFSREAALSINVFDNFTYTLETIIQARAKGLRLVSVPINVNGELRKSKLMKNNLHYITRSLITMLRMFIVYRPFRFFGVLSAILTLSGVAVGCRYLFYYFTHSGVGHIQSLILSAILIIIGFQTLLLAVISDLLSINRKLLESIQKNSKFNLRK